MLKAQIKSGHIVATNEIVSRIFGVREHENSRNKLQMSIDDGTAASGSPKQVKRY